MKIQLREFDGCFSFDMQAENMADAALLTRMSINRKKAIGYAETLVSKDGAFTAAVTILKHKNPTSFVPTKR